MTRSSQEASSARARTPLASGPDPLRAEHEGPEAVGRLVMALGGAIALKLDPTFYSPWPDQVDNALMAHCALAAVVAAAHLGGYRLGRWATPMDVIAGLCVVAVTGGTVSPLFFYLLFPIITVAFSRGFEAGATTTALATLGFLVVGLPTSPGGPLVEIYRSVLRPFALLMLGYLISRQGEIQNVMRRRLALLASLSTIGNPRFGIQHTLERATQQIRASYEADECLIAYRRSGQPDGIAVRSTFMQTQTDVLGGPVADLLLSLPQTCAVRVTSTELIPYGGTLDRHTAERAEALRDVLEARSFLTLPLPGGTLRTGRLFLMTADSQAFEPEEIRHLLNVSAQLMSIVEKVDLLDHIASLSAQRERQRLADDIHDRAIQPYLGLQLAIAAATKRPGLTPEVAADLEAVADLARQGVVELRQLLAGQRESTSDEPAVLAMAIGQLAEQASQHFGLEVRRQIEADIRIPDRLVADLLSMLTEALSNVRRHTPSPWAEIRVTRDAEQIVLSVTNARESRAPTAFTPRSLMYRLDKLGGTLDITHTEQDTTVTARIPL